MRSTLTPKLLRQNEPTQTTMAAQSLAESFLRDHPELRPFLLSSARPTGTIIGSGSYGSVEEVAIPGAVCAAKKIHDFFQDPRQMPREGIEKAASEFVRECQLMSTLRHPHIVQFLGVCFLPGSRMPALVMEKLATSLHDILDPEPEPPTKPFIPVSLKRSVLHDVARGLSFLHSHSPPIIHRDLSARNVLLNEGMVAKLADLGMARIVPRLRVSTMTKAPGASIYMPPEALEDESRYDVTIDIFSLGVVAIFTLSQMFPKPLAAAYMDDSGRMVGRTELERRGNYMQEVKRQFREGHPLVQMIQRCLKNRLRERLTIQQVMGWLEEARAEVEGGEYDMNKLSLAQLLQSRNLHIQQQQQEVRSQRENIQQQQRENRSLRENVQQQQRENRSLREQNDVQKAQIQSLEEQNQSLQAENAALKQSQKVCDIHLSCLKFDLSLSLPPGHTYCPYSQTSCVRSHSSLFCKTSFFSVSMYFMVGYPKLLFIASKFAMALSVLRQQNFCILHRYFHTPLLCGYTCHALTSTGFFRISRYFIHKLCSISIEILKYIIG